MCGNMYWRVFFEVWSAPGNWFWFVPYSDGGAIGATSTAAEAIREACAVIEAMAMRSASNGIDDRL
jgi:hypothetical protein